MRRSSIIISAVFHVFFVIVAMVGLPFMAREFVIPPPMTVDLIDIAKITETDKVTPQPIAPEKEEPKEATPPPAAKNTAEQAVTPVDTPPVKQPDKKETKPEEKEAIPDKKALPEKKKPEKKKEEKKPEPPKDFSSVLKNLADPKDTKAKTPPDEKADKNAPPAPGQNAPVGAKMTMSEEDALRAQLEKCWNVPFGAKDAENMIVEIFMVINPDRTLREARIVNTVRYNTDSFFRAAADSALRAVRSPLCSPFDLPADKYNTWNNITVTFNPKDMF